MKLIVNAFKTQKGLTLIELLIVLVLLALIAGISGNILIIALRSDAKAQTGTLVRQTGNYATALFGDTVRTAYGFAGVSNDSGTTYTLTCPTTSSQYNVVRFFSNVTSYQSHTPDEIFDCGQYASIGTDVRFNNSSLLPGNMYINGTDATQMCKINCIEPIGSPPIISISFTLRFNKSNSTLVENIASFPFSTTTVMRNSNAECAATDPAGSCN